VRLGYIEASGFRGFRQSTRVDVPAGFLVITGRNGTGKSSLVDAVEFVLSGNIDKYPAEVGGRETARDYIWWRGEGRPETHFVTLGFIDDHGGTTEVTRSREKGLSIASSELESLFCDAKLKPPDPMRNLCRTSIIRDELIAALSWDQTDPARFEFVRSALGALAPVDLVARLNKAVAVIETIRAEAEQHAQRVGAQLQSALAELSEARASAMQAADLQSALNAIRTTLSLEDASVGELLSACRAHIARRRASLDSGAALPGKLRQLDALVKELGGGGQTDHLARPADAMRDREAAYQTARSRREATEQHLASEQGANKTAASLAGLLEHGRKLGLAAGRCPLCDAARTDVQFREALNNLEARIGAMAGSLAELNAALVKERAEEQTALVDLEKARAEHERISQALRRVSREREVALELWRQVVPNANALPSPGEAEGQVSTERNRLNELEQHMFVLEASQSIDRVARLEGQATAIRQESDRAAAREAAAEGAAAQLKEAERGIKRVNAEIVDERLALLSPLLSELYYRLRPHRNWRDIDYAIRGDVRKFLSLRVGEGLNPQFLFSSGERRAAGLAFLLAVGLSRSWCRWRTLVLDDPVQHVDDFRALHLVEVLSAIRIAGYQLICAVEDPELADLLCRRLRSSWVSPGARVDLDADAVSGSRVVKWSPVHPLPSRVIIESAAD
jgi:DNA repair exonuclease SbcCD ATPase subunit